MSNTKTEAKRPPKAIGLADQLVSQFEDWTLAHLASDELRRLDAIEQRHNEMMANPCPEWDNKAYMQAIANLRSQLAKAVAEEREACAKVCEQVRRPDGTNDLAWECAIAIRARSNT